MPKEVLVDNARALVSQHDPERQILVFAQRLEEFASYWGFKPRACRPLSRVNQVDVWRQSG